MLSALGGYLKQKREPAVIMVVIRVGFVTTALKNNQI
jgi:hypothetical protein